VARSTIANASRHLTANGAEKCLAQLREIERVLVAGKP
jgi:hypothetical protein